MKVSEIGTILDLTMKIRENGSIFNPLFVSAPGCGKTEETQAWAKNRGYECIVLTAAVLEAPELRGFPVVETIDGVQRQTTALPSLWPTKGKGVIILEEINRGNSSIMNAIFSLTDARRGFDNYKLPNGWIVIGCVNPEDHYDVNAMDSALKNRFEIFNMHYDKTDHLNFMRANEYDKNILMFVESGTWVYKSPEEIANNSGAIYVSPRSFSKLNAILRAGVEERHELMFYQTILGQHVGSDFYKFKNNCRPVLYKDLVDNFKDASQRLQSFCDPKNFKNGMISITVQDILETKDISDDLLYEVCKIIPADQSITLIQDLELKRNDKDLFTRLVRSHADLKKQFKDVLVNVT